MQPSSYPSVSDRSTSDPSHLPSSSSKPSSKPSSQPTIEDSSTPSLSSGSSRKPSSHPSLQPFKQPSLVPPTCLVFNQDIQLRPDPIIHVHDNKGGHPLVSRDALPPQYAKYSSLHRIPASHVTDVLNSLTKTKGITIAEA